MKILVTNNHMRKLGGSETFTYTLAASLKASGHEVCLFTHQPGMVSAMLWKTYGVRPMAVKENFDLILASHNTCVDVLKGRGPIIQTCHGTIPKLEQPSANANAYVAISEEVAIHVEKLTGCNATLIVNGIDCNRFRPLTPLNTKVKKVLSLAHDDEFNKKASEIFAKHGVALLSLNKYTNPVWDVENHINQADMVISLGRGAYEAMACARPVLVMDKRPYQPALGDGLITSGNIRTLIKYNCSGRALKRTDMEEMISQALACYSPKLGAWARSYAVQNHNIDTQKDLYLELYQNNFNK